MTYKTVCALAVAAMLLTLPCAREARAQQPGEADLRAEVEALKKGQEAILKELQEIKRLLQTRQAPPAGPDAKTITLDLSGHLIQGDPKAPLTLVEFSDYQCPFCSRHHQETQPKIQEELIKTGKVRRVFFDLPLDMHPNAFKAAQASRCALDQQKYFEMQDRLFASSQTLDQWSTHATAVGLDLPKFMQCMETNQHADEVRKDMAQAQKAGIQSTPIFLLARSDPADANKVLGVTLITGARPYDYFKREIEQALAAKP